MLARYVHSFGEKFGIYITPGIPVAAYNENTPIEGTPFHARDIVSDTTDYELNYNSKYSKAGQPGVMYFIDYNKNPIAAQAYLNSWADELASWGVDYVKLDGVGTSDVADVEHWSEALAQTGRPIHLEIANQMNIADASTWQQYANGWRIEGDIENYSTTNGGGYTQLLPSRTGTSLRCGLQTPQHGFLQPVRAGGTISIHWKSETGAPMA